MTDVDMNNVNHPKHYQMPGGIETIDMIKNTLGEEGFMNYCWGNAIKYICRWKGKGGMESLEKAKWYINRMEKTTSENDLRKVFESEANN